MAASANPDILYYHEAMQAPDKEKFVLEMEQEVKQEIDEDELLETSKRFN